MRDWPVRGVYAIFPTLSGWKGLEMLVLVFTDSFTEASRTEAALLHPRYEMDLRCTIILMVFLVRMVSDLFGSSSRDWLGANSKVTRCASVASKSWASIKAKWLPIQMRGPTPKGM